jgi:hypothetical protein
MKLVPLFRFWGDKGHAEESDLTDPLEDDMPQLPAEEQPEDPPEEAEETTDSAEEEKEEEEKKETEEENKDPKTFAGGDDDMLKVFSSVEEEFVDNSALATEIEDIPASELLQELRTLAAAFGRPTSVAEEEDA